MVTGKLVRAQLLNASETTNPLTGLKHIQLTNS